MLETWVRTLDREDPLEQGMATHSSILACRISMDRGAWQPTELDTTEATKQQQQHLLFPSCFIWKQITAKISLYL